MKLGPFFLSAFVGILSAALWGDIPYGGTDPIDGRHPAVFAMGLISGIACYDIYRSYKTWNSTPSLIRASLYLVLASLLWHFIEFNSSVRTLSPTFFTFNRPQGPGTLFGGSLAFLLHSLSVLLSLAIVRILSVSRRSSAPEESKADQ